MTTSTLPGSTYRLQFTPEFRFSHALAIIPYLKELGITHLYASPICRSRKGSTHGYDVCDPAMVNPELGSLDEFTTLLSAASQAGLGWLQDIVPNHMAYSHENPYLVEVLEQGERSRYSEFFDITWNHQNPSLCGKVLAPFLGKPYGQCVIDGELSIVFENGGLWVAYYDKRYPLAPETYPLVLGTELMISKSEILPDYTTLRHFSTLLGTLLNAPSETSPETITERKLVLCEFIMSDESLISYVRYAAALFSTGAPEGNNRFDALMSRQHYRLSFWKVAAEELNYRRFFTVSDLICVRVEHEWVFEITHAFILDFVNRGLITGLRIDHIDGLFNPAVYLERLYAKAPNTYISVEKILDINEKLPESWPVHGTTGYDFLNYCNYVFCDNRTEKRYSRLYERFTGMCTPVVELQREKKRLIIGKHMAGDIDSLAHLILSIASTDLMGRDITLYALRRALVEILTHFPVYRTYITENSFTDYDGWCIKTALTLSRLSLPGLAVEFDFIERFLMMKGDTILQKQFDEKWKHGVMRFQQFTGPLMAKGFEDTLFYVYNRHIALNEVGGWPTHFGIPLKEFHTFISQRSATFPHSMNATATHDTKRGEDTRARLQVLTEIPQEWDRAIKSWRSFTTANLTVDNKNSWPDRNDEYLFYQTLVGTLPMDGIINDDYISRIREYMIKAVREAKVHTAWIRPDEHYEQAIRSFVDKCLQPGSTSLFTDSLTTFSRKVTWHGVLNSLSQLVLKCTLPGIPDIYQGTEYWDFTLVDPDNRRPVDYEKRAESLPAISDHSHWTNELILDTTKQFCLRVLLQERNRHQALFTSSTSVPAGIRGTFGREIITITRVHKSEGLLVVAPRFTTHLVKPGELPTGKRVWQDTRILPPRALWHKDLYNVFTGTSMRCGSEQYVGDLLESFPLGVFITRG